jgi:hypothetical protein
LYTPSMPRSPVAMQTLDPLRGSFGA